MQTAVRNAYSEKSPKLKPPQPQQRSKERAADCGANRNDYPWAGYPPGGFGLLLGHHTWSSPLPSEFQLGFCCEAFCKVIKQGREVATMDNLIKRPHLPKERRSTKTAESGNRIQRPQRKIHFGSFLLGGLCSLVARPQLDL